MTLISQAQFHSPCFSTKFYTPSMPKKPKGKILSYIFLPMIFKSFLWPTGRSGKGASKLFLPQFLFLVPQSQLLLCRHPLPVIKDVMQVLAFSKLHLFSKGISGRHVTGFIALAFPIGTKALPDPQ